MTDREKTHEPPEYEELEKRVDSVWPELKRLTDEVNATDRDELEDFTGGYMVSHKLLRYLLAVNRKYCEVERREIICPQCNHMLKAGNPDVLFEV